MWSFLIRGGVAVVVLTALWVFTAQWCSLLIDWVYTVPLATLPSTPLGWNGTYLQFGSSVEGMEGPKALEASLLESSNQARAAQRNIDETDRFAELVAERNSTASPIRENEAKLLR
jgi:hypothetical protein